MSPLGPSPFSHSSKAQRVLACVRCQQRKVKCDRSFPCEHCQNSHVQCIPATLAPRGPRRRRFPERELLERLREYESLLRKNNIKFEPLHKDGQRIEENEPPSMHEDSHVEDEVSEIMGKDSSASPSVVKSEGMYETRNTIWQAMSQAYRDPGDDSDSSDADAREMILKRAWNRYFENDDDLLFGTRKIAVDLCTLHPDTVQIFQLWQIYLDNVNPLLKVTHTPSLQTRIVEAAGNISNMKPAFEALMFSIYCIAILSLDTADCLLMFGSSQGGLLARYQFGCQQALLNCGFLRCHERDCLTALYLYLISVRPSTVPQALSSMLGVAIRIAQRMGIHDEQFLSKCGVLEAEMRRRLWWSLVQFDTRIGELADFKAATLNSSWDCKIPRNVNDSEFRPEMKEPPPTQGKVTEAIFSVVRSELGDFVRHTTSHLSFDTPPSKSSSENCRSSPISSANELPNFEKTIEDKYFSFCDSGNPIHVMTIWTTRGHIAKHRLASMHQTQQDRDAAIPYALKMLECDTKIMASPLTKRFRWMTNWYFPFAAYIQIAQHLTVQSFNKKSEQAWEVMSDNYNARFATLPGGFDENPFFKIFSNVILQAWNAQEAIVGTFKQTAITPRIVLSIRDKLAQIALNTQRPEPGDVDTGSSELTTAKAEMGSQGLLYSMGAQDGWPELPGMSSMDFDVNQLDWSAMDWDVGNGMPNGADLSLP